MGVISVVIEEITTNVIEVVVEVGTGGAKSFLNLTDTPSTYAGHKGLVPTVNEDENGLVFTNPSGVIKVQNEALSFETTSAQLSLLYPDMPDDGQVYSISNNIIFIKFNTNTWTFKSLDILP